MRVLPGGAYLVVHMQVDQLLIELHAVYGRARAPVGIASIDSFFRGADRCGLRLFAREPNVW